MDIDDSIDYASIMRAIRSAFHRVSLECKGAQYAISTSSGTPQMHACWLILASSGEIPATMLQTRPPQFVTTDRPAVEEVDLSVIAPRELAMQSMPASAAQFARTPFPVLIQGETGTGKELVARYIHRLSGLPADADYARSVDNRAVSRLSHCAAARFEIE